MKFNSKIMRSNIDIVVDDMSNESIQKEQDWSNSYLIAMFDYKSSSMLLL